MRKILLSIAAMAAVMSVEAQTTYNYFDPADCDADGWLWFDTQAKIDKYVGFQGLGANPKIMLQSATFENAQMGFDEPTCDPAMKGYNSEGVQGGDGSWTGAISLCGSSTANGSDSPNGGAIMLHLPDCAEFDLKLSTESEYMCVGLQGAKGHVEAVDCGVIQTYLRMGVFLNRPLAKAHQYTWQNIQNVENENTGLKLSSQAGEPVTALVRNNRGDALLIQAIKVLTYTNVNGAGVNDVFDDDDNAPVEFFNMQGVKVSGDQPGLYVRRQGSKSTKVLVK